MLKVKSQGFFPPIYLTYLVRVLAINTHEIGYITFLCFLTSCWYTICCGILKKTWLIFIVELHTTLSIQQNDSRSTNRCKLPTLHISKLYMLHFFPVHCYCHLLANRNSEPPKCVFMFYCRILNTKICPAMKDLDIKK